jgi:hypothetical protein
MRCIINNSNGASATTTASRDLAKVRAFPIHAVVYPICVLAAYCDQHAQLFCVLSLVKRSAKYNLRAFINVVVLCLLLFLLYRVRSSY